MQLLVLVKSIRSTSSWSGHHALHSFLLLVWQINEESFRLSAVHSELSRRTFPIASFSLHLPNMPETKTLPSRTFAIQVHRQHAVRVRDELEQAASQTQWTTLTKESLQKDDDGETSSSSSSSLSLNHGIGDIESMPFTEQTTYIPSPTECGARKVRTGYNTIITRNAACSPGDLPPLARQHISWAGRVTHQTTSILDESSHNSKCIDADKSGKKFLADADELCTSVAALAFQQLTACGFFFAETEDRRADELRLDVRPKSFALPLCQELQRLATDAKISPRADTDPNDPFDGPMRMTRSIAKSACILNAVFDSLIESAQNAPTTCFWGITPTPEHATMINKLNDFAKKEVRIAKPGDTTCYVDTPTSRAYYKLQQIFDQYLTPLMLWDKTMDGSLGAGLDLGASPGGWTQVLYQNGLTPVVSVDPGLLAPRVERLEGVQYIKGDFNGDDAVIREIASASPYSAIVCDANITHGCDEKIMEMFGRIAGELEKTGSEAEQLSLLITLPAVLVLTLKFAYKTEQSMKRNYAAAIKRIPTLLTSIVDAQCRTSTSISRDRIACRYTVVHLHANSDSERTVLAIFEDISDEDGRKRKRR